MVTIQPSSVKRLMRDYKDIQLDPIPFISAQPESGDIFTWHCNLFPDDGPYSGTIFHVKLKFPLEYPNKPPRVQLCTSIPHPNVFDWNYGDNYPYICLEEGSATEAYAGWSTAYSVGSILMQLSAFLFDACVPQYGNRVVNNVIRSKSITETKAKAQLFKCKCGHNHQQPNPKLHNNTATVVPANKLNFDTNKLGNNGVYGICYWDKLDSAITREIFSYIKPFDARNCMSLSKFHHNVLKSMRLVMRNNLLCFHRRCAFEDNNNTEILGFGLLYDTHPKDNTAIKSFSAVLDTVSYTAFISDNVRHGIWKHPFTHFLPIIINQNHGARAFPIIEKLIAGLDLNGGKFNANTALFLATNLMNSMVVSLVSESDNDNKSTVIDTYGYEIPNLSNNIALHASEKAMIAYTNFHHLLIALAIKYPSIRIEANNQLHTFITKPEYRNKTYTPNIGELLVLLSIADKYNWNDLAPYYIIECFTRNVRWLFKKRPELSYIHNNQYEQSPSICYRLRNTFMNSLTSMRLLMFQVFFLDSIRPNNESLNDMYNSYNSRLGRPAAGFGYKLQKAIKNIIKVNEFDQFFDRIRLTRKSPKQLECILLNAIKQSSINKYHDINLVPHTTKFPALYRTCTCTYWTNKTIIYQGKSLCRYEDPIQYYTLAGIHIPKYYLQQLQQQAKQEPTVQQISKPLINLPNKDTISHNITTIQGCSHSSLAPQHTVSKSNNATNQSAITAASTVVPIIATSTHTTMVKAENSNTTTAVITRNRILDDDNVFPSLSSSVVITKIPAHLNQTFYPEGTTPRYNINHMRYNNNKSHTNNAAYSSNTRFNNSSANPRFNKSNKNHHASNITSNSHTNKIDTYSSIKRTSAPPKAKQPNGNTSTIMHNNVFDALVPE